MGILFVGTVLPNIHAQEEFDEEFVEYVLDHIASIKELLNQSREAYVNGDKELAMKLATIAYLDHYEYIEWELLQYNEELIEDVEWMMREDLRGMIKDGAPISEVTQQIDTILEKLDSIAAIVPEFGVIAIMILILALTSSIMLLKKSSLNIYR